MGMTPDLFSEQFPSIAVHCGPGGLTDLLAALETRDVKAGESVTTDGEYCDSLFLVTGGTLVSQIKSGDETITLGTLKQGDSIGEINILDPGPSASTVTATDDSTVLVLSHDAFHNLDKPHPIMTGNILRMLSSLMIERCRAADKLLFSKYGYTESNDSDTTGKGPNLLQRGQHVLQKLLGHKEI